MNGSRYRHTYSKVSWFSRKSLQASNWVILVMAIAARTEPQTVAKKSYHFRMILMLDHKLNLQLAIAI